MNTVHAILRLRQVIRRQHKAIATEETYVFWLRRYMAAVDRMPATLASNKKLEQFLTDLACLHNVSASTQNQAPNAILFSTNMSSSDRSRTWMPCEPSDQSTCVEPPAWRKHGLCCRAAATSVSIPQT